MRRATVGHCVRPARRSPLRDGPCVSPEAAHGQPKSNTGERGHEENDKIVRISNAAQVVVTLVSSTSPTTGCASSYSRPPTTSLPVRVLLSPGFPTVAERLPSTPAAEACGPSSRTTWGAMGLGVAAGTSPAITAI